MVSRKTKYLVSPKSKTQVETSLVDKSGMFLLLLDSDTTVHYNFSTEHEAIEGLLKENASIKALNDKLIETNNELEEKLERSRKNTANRAKRVNEALEYLYELIPEEERESVRLKSRRILNGE